MPPAVRRLFRFGPFRLDATDRLLFKGDEAVALTPKAVDVLILLVENHGRVLTKQELIHKVWPDTTVEENNLIQNISLLRKVLCEEAEERRFIETLPRRGYRFVAPVREDPDGNSGPAYLKQSHIQLPVDLEQPGAEDVADRTSPATVDPGLPFARSVAPGGPATIDAPEGARLARPLRSSWRAWSVVVVLVAVTAAAIWSQRRLRDEPVERLAISRLTSSGRAVLATLSSDGKHLAYVLDGPEGRSLRIQQVATGSEAEVRAPVAADYWGLTISPDSAYLYFVSWNRNTPDAALYRLPVLGGAPQLLIDNVGGPISFSPDGGRFAFVREHDERGNSRLMIASLQELRPQTLLTLKDRWSMSTAMSGPAWSPDGRTIAVWIGNPNARHGVRERTLVAVDVADGSTRPVGARSWFNVGRSVWGPEGDRLLFTASDQPSHPRQIWSLAFPSGAARQLTIDLNDYGSVSSIESGATAVAAVRTEVVHELWVENARAEPMLLVSQVGNYLGTEGFCWTPNGQIVYRALGSEGLDLWVADLQTGDRAQLTAESGNNFQPVVSPDGQYIVFTSDRTGQTNIWRMDIDASDVRQLTFGREDARPRISPDGRWVVYQQGNSDGIRITLWKVSIDGGSPIRLTPSQSSHAIRPAISSDGRWVAYYYMDRESWGIATMPFEGGEPTRKFWIPPTARERVVRWTPDASGLAYVKENEGLSELWVQPLGAGPPQYLRSFPAGHVSVFEWSPDGQRLAWIRSNATSDVVRIELH